MRIDLTNEELTDLLVSQGILNRNQYVKVTRRSQYNQAEGIVLFVDYKEKHGGKQK